MGDTHDDKGTTFPNLDGYQEITVLRSLVTLRSRRSTHWGYPTRHLAS